MLHSQKNDANLADYLEQKQERLKFVVLAPSALSCLIKVDRRFCRRVMGLIVEM